MPSRRVRVGLSEGIHARPAALFVKAAAGSDLEVRISKEGQEPVNAASILSVLGLGVQNGDEVILEADGERAEIALNDLALILESDSGEVGSGS